MIGYRENTFNRKVLGFPITVTETKDGVQRAQYLKDGADTDIGAITTDRWTAMVTARLPDGRTKNEAIIPYGMTKEQAFTALRRWVVAMAFQLPEGEAM